MVSQNENQKAVAQELDSEADVAPECQWCCPIQRGLEGQGGGGGGGGKALRAWNTHSRILIIFSATTPHPNPQPVQQHTVPSEDAGMLPGQKRWAVKLRFNPSCQRLEAGFNSIRYDSWEPGWDQLKSQLHWIPSGLQGSLT